MTDELVTTAEEHPEGPGASLARVEPTPSPAMGGIVRPVVEVAEVSEAFRQYQDLVQRLTDDSDYTQIGRKRFRNKSGWRKLAVAFNVNTTLVERVYERDSAGRIVRAEVVARAVAPNGRVQDGLGACDVTERCCEAAHGGTCSNRQKWHVHCEVGCTGFIHFSKPSHDLPATAHTRASNRAQADLFGAGEVSAEEISHRDVECDQPHLQPAGVEGFQSLPEEAGAHRIVAAAMKALPAGVDRSPLEAFRKEHGWPMPFERLMELLSMAVAALSADVEAPTLEPTPHPHLPNLASKEAVNRIIDNADPEMVKDLSKQASQKKAAEIDNLLIANGQTTAGGVDERRRRLIAASILLDVPAEDAPDEMPQESGQSEPDPGRPFDDPDQPHQIAGPDQQEAMI